MKTSKELARLAALAIFFVSLTCLAVVPAANAATVMKVYNGTNASVDVWINSTNPPCNKMKATNDRTGAEITITVPDTFKSNNGKGVFALPAGDTATLSRKDNELVINGSVSFNAIPVCPCGGDGQPPCPVVPGFNLPAKLVNGVTQFEYALNTGFEAIDIGCGNGVNSKIRVALDGGNPVWANNVTHAPVSTIQNGPIDIARRIDSNCEAVGVFPFSITDCVTNPNRPCGQPICPLRGVRTCQLDRQGSGGVVTVGVYGFDAL